MTAVLIVAILCATLLAAYVFGTWMCWIQRREDRRVELLEQLLPIDGNTPEYLLDVVDALANAGPGLVSRQHLRVVVLRARLHAFQADMDRLDWAVAQQEVAVAAVRELLL